MTETGVVSIFISAIVFGWVAVVVGTVVHVRHRDKTLRHETIRAALAKDQQLPTELLGDPQGGRTSRSDVSYGVLLLFGSAGVSAFLWSSHNRNWAVGLVAVALGLGYVVSHAIAWRGSARRSS